MIALRKDAAKQRSPHQEAALPAHRRHHFIRWRFVAPHKPLALGDLAPEKILVFTRKALGVEWLCLALEQRAPQQHIPGAALLEVEHRARRHYRTLVKPAFDHPARRFAVEVWIDRPQHAIASKSLDGREQRFEPAHRCKLV